MPRTTSGTIRINPIRTVTMAAAAARFCGHQRRRSKGGQIARATTAAHANAARKSQMIHMPIASRTKMSANWPTRCFEGVPAGLEMASLISFGAAFGEDRPIERLEAFKALRSGRDRSIDGEIVSQTAEHDRVAAGRQRKVGFLRPDGDHFAIFGQ